MLIEMEPLLRIDVWYDLRARVWVGHYRPLGLYSQANNSDEAVEAMRDQIRLWAEVATPRMHGAIHPPSQFN